MAGVPGHILIKTEKINFSLFIGTRSDNISSSVRKLFKPEYMLKLAIQREGGQNTVSYKRFLSIISIVSISIFLSVNGNAQSSDRLAEVSESDNTTPDNGAPQDKATLEKLHDSTDASTETSTSTESTVSDENGAGPASIDPSGKWFVSMNGVVTGPFTAAEIHEKLGQKIISADAVVAREGTMDWIPVTQLPKPSGASSTNTPKTETEKWWVTRDGATIGPFTVAQMNDMIQKKEIVPSTDVCRYGTKKWVKASTIFKFVQSAPAAVDASTVSTVDKGATEHKRPSAARSALLQIGVSLLASGAILMVSSIACVARGDAPEGSEWALNNEACAGTLLASGAILGVISIPFIVGGTREKNPPAVSILGAPDRFGLGFTKTF